MRFAQPSLPLVFDRAAAGAAGVGTSAVRRRLDQGHWVRLRPGAYCLRATYDAASDDERYLLLAVATWLAGHRERALSHVSACAAWGWPLPSPAPRQVWLTEAPGPGAWTRDRGAVSLEVASLAAEDVVELSWEWLAPYSLRLTAPARSVADTLRHERPVVSVPMGDAALRAGVDPGAVSAVLERQGVWPYVARGRRAARLLDGRRETWLESVSVVAFDELDLPLPEAQVNLLDRHGEFVGRLDFLWRREMTAGEADGRGKYDDAAGGGGGSTTMSALWAEKQREDAVRRTGLGLARWGTAEALRHTGELRDRVMDGFRVARPEAFDGVLVPSPPPLVRPDLLPQGLLALRRLVPPAALGQGLPLAEP